MGTIDLCPTLALGGNDGGGNLEELVGLKGGPAHQTAVDAVLGGEIAGVSAVHAPSVEEGNVVGGG